MIALFVLLVILTGALFFFGIFTSEDGGFNIGVSFVVMLVITILVGVDLFYEFEEIPTAIDVYRGRTTLEITYRDSVAIDSVVVWKERMK